MRPFLVIILALLPFLLTAQVSVVGVATAWTDSFREWIIYTEDEAVEGSLQLRWQDRWSEWDYRIGEVTGQIRQKWRDEPSAWELRSGTDIITIRTVWKDDFRHWRITDGTQQVTLQTRYGNLWDEWSLREADGFFNVYTNIEGDPRDWVIEQDWDNPFSQPMQMAMAFIAIYNSIPKE